MGYLLNASILALRSGARKRRRPPSGRDASLPQVLAIVTLGCVPGPTLTQALAMGGRAAWRSAWLAAPALVVALSRTVLVWAAPVAAVAIARGGGLSRMAAAGPLGAVSGALVALATPRAIAIVAGLFFSGQLLAAALRTAYLAGALPVLGARLAYAPAERRFARGLGYGFARLLGTALLALALDLVGQLLALAWVVGALAITAQRLRGGHPFAPAALVAGACLAAVLALVAVPLAGDAALARAAIAGDAPARALWEGVLRVARRPAAFLALSLSLAVVTLSVFATLQGASAAALAATRGAPALLVAGPQLMAAVLSAAIAALVDLWRLGAIAALACGDDGAARQ
jgi:hypothetical protein